MELLETHGFPDEYADLARKASRVFNVGVYFHKPLPSWLAKNGKVALLGDSCHATTPFLYCDVMCLVVLIFFPVIRRKCSVIQCLCLESHTTGRLVPRHNIFPVCSSCLVVLFLPYVMHCSRVESYAATAVAAELACLRSIDLFGLQGDLAVPTEPNRRADCHTK